MQHPNIMHYVATLSVVVGDTRGYGYVGPSELYRAATPGGPGRAIRTSADLADWIGGVRTAERREPFTFVVTLDCVLRLAPRRSEHVACAGGDRVLAAGEMTFTLVGDRPAVSGVSNQSTGYCPGLESWSAVDAALDAAGISRSAGFTTEIVFRRCIAASCSEVNVVRDAFFVCAFCDVDLPAEWNVGS